MDESRYLRALSDQSLGKMTADKAARAGDKHAFAVPAHVLRFHGLYYTTIQRGDKGKRSPRRWTAPPGEEAGARLGGTNSGNSPGGLGALRGGRVVEECELVCRRIPVQ